MFNNYLMKISYDGSMYQGWQRQSNAKSIQGEIENVLSKLYGSKVTINGSGRTDSGVHSLGQTANFVVDKTIPDDRLKRILNNMLPLDIRVEDIHRVNHEFHARYNAIGKTYIYRIKNKDKLSCFESRYYWGVDYPIDLELMKKAADLLLGEKDFRAFMASGSKVKTTVRKIHKIEIKRSDDYLEIEYHGNGFLYNMVRIITSLLVSIGKGEKELDTINKALASDTRKYTTSTAPAAGLYLKEVIYKKSI